MVQAREIIWNRFLQCAESHTRLGLKLGTWSFGALMWRAVLESTGWKLMSWKSSWSSECDSGASSSSRLQEQQWQTGDCIAELNYSNLYNAQHSLLYPVWFGGRKWGIYLLFGFFHSSPLKQECTAKPWRVMCQFCKVRITLPFGETI